MSTDYIVPSSKVGFYGIGFFDDSSEMQEMLRNLIAPVRDLVEFSALGNPPHISCRYLGYASDITPEQVEFLLPDFKEIMLSFLPLAFTLDSFRFSWIEFPNKSSKRIMIDIKAPKLNALHKKLLEVTPHLPVFSGVEGKNFRPHISLATVKDPTAEKLFKIQNELKKINFTKNSMAFSLSKCFVAYPKQKIMGI